MVGYAQNKEYWFRVKDLSQGYKYSIKNDDDKCKSQFTAYTDKIVINEGFNYYFIINMCTGVFYLVNYDEKLEQISKVLIEQNYDLLTKDNVKNLDLENDDFQVLNLYGTSTIKQMIEKRNVYEATIINKDNVDYGNEDFVIEILAPTSKDNKHKSIVIISDKLVVGDCN